MEWPSQWTSPTGTPRLRIPAKKLAKLEIALMMPTIEGPAMKEIKSQNMKPKALFRKLVA